MIDRWTLTRRLVPAAVIFVAAAILSVVAYRNLAARQLAANASCRTPAPAAELETTPAVADDPIYRVALRIPLTLDGPTGVASTQNGEILVCGDDRVLLLGRDGDLIAEHRVAGNAQCVATDDHGAIYVGLDRNVVTIDATAGQHALWSDLDERTIITSIATAGENVYVADAGNRRVVVYDRGGRVLDFIRGFRVPSAYFDVARADTTDIWIADPGRHKVNLYGPTGRRGVAWGLYSNDPEGFVGCCNPVHIAVTPDGSVVTAEKGSMRIRVHARDGSLVGAVAGPEVFTVPEGDLDIAVFGDGRIMALAPIAREIIIFEPIGRQG